MVFNMSEDFMPMPRSAEQFVNCFRMSMEAAGNTSYKLLLLSIESV